ncbi:hypothetical protein [Kineosporia babensis]|uniref:Uncharacterized protein n=1 Tax=Kineosporia babensis TaxID=499548 RepID=A0A9X1NQD0_9ACTN|nr:hypothetical protein [Kineosporia babensis]MCD5317253.1 hypothetical protein [Kineosporia babensis]
MSKDYVAKHLAREQDISYTEALRRVQSATVQENPLLTEVKRECWDLIGEKVSYRFGSGIVASVQFADELRLPSPPRIERLKIHVMENDYSSLTWCPTETIPGIRLGGETLPGVQTGDVTIESRIGFRCEMKKSEPIEDPTLDFPQEYLDEDHVLVSLERDVLLRWHAVLVEGKRPDLIFSCGEARQPSTMVRAF